jgi:hypothetical protein
VRDRHDTLTSNQNNRIHRLRLDHLLRIHTHQIPQIHRRRTRETLMNTNCREIHREPSIELNPTFDGFDKLRDITVARIETRVRIHDSDDGAGKCIFAVAERFDEDFA